MTPKPPRPPKKSAAKGRTADRLDRLISAALFSRAMDEAKKPCKRLSKATVRKILSMAGKRRVIRLPPLPSKPARGGRT